MAVLRILGMYTMDELKRKDWEKVGNYRATKGHDYTERCVCKSFVFSCNITLGRCKARKPCGECHYEPMTFDPTATQVASISPSSGPQDQEAEEVDEV